MDLLRLLFALMVVCVHTFNLSRSPALAFIPNYLNSAIAVQGFFILSGFLIFRSYENSRSLKDYFSKRIRRLYPGYFAVVVSCAIGGIFLTTLPSATYTDGVWRYLAANLSFMTFLHPTLPGVFVEQRYAAVNGALWTIKIEIMFYLCVPLLAGWVRRFNKPAILIGVYLLSCAYRAYFEHLWAATGAEEYYSLSVQLPGQLMYFISGAGFYYFFESCRDRLGRIMLVAVLAYPLAVSLNLDLLQPLLLACIVIGASFVYYVGNAGKYGDLSYGVYIIHFPIIQSLVYYGAFKASPVAAACAAVGLALGLALVSWHFVEKPFLSKRSHYRQVEKATA